MYFYFENLDEKTRVFMLREVMLDIEKNTLNPSKRFNEKGKLEYRSILKEAITAHEEGWLARKLWEGGCFVSHFPRPKKGGGFSMITVTRPTADTFAEGEFNRFYIRGVCVRALEEGIPNVEVYRGKQVALPRPESEAMIGRKLDARALLEDLRASPGVEPALGLPPGPNSGLTVKLTKS